ncbi:MAG: hypothetical protein KF890_04155 [Nitrospira sp.]|nr:hypothetical protein [Nitrospira sp.]
MKVLRSVIIPAIAVLTFPSFSSAESGQGMETVTFPQNDKCTANQPCRTVMGEIVRVEEMYVLKQPNGSEIHVNVEPETRVRGLHKEGDKVAAQLNSRGVAQAVVKLKELPEPGLEAPGKTLDDLR